jgi:hypothetical protein
MPVTPLGSAGIRAAARCQLFLSLGSPWCADNRLEASVKWRNNVKTERRSFQVRSGKSRGSANNEITTEALDVLREQ